MSALEFTNKIKAKFGDIVSEPTEFRGEITLKISDAEKIFEVCCFAKSFGLDYLVDISSIDNYGEDPRWTVVYHLRAIGNGTEICLKTDVSEEKSELPSVLPVWRTANWHEREIYDMMGIRFAGHPDLRRILMWEGYPYHPLRKDFPLAGKPSDLPGVAFTKISPSSSSTMRKTPCVAGCDGPMFSTIFSPCASDNSSSAAAVRAAESRISMS